MSMKNKLNDNFRLDGYTKELKMSRLKNLGVPDHVAVSMTDRQIQEYYEKFEPSQFFSLCAFISIALMFFFPTIALAIIVIAFLIEFRYLWLILAVVLGLFFYGTDNIDKTPEKETKTIQYQKHYIKTKNTKNKYLVESEEDVIDDEE